jgi:hypothetical protein
MPPISGSFAPMKGALVHLAAPGGTPSIIAFPFNPATLRRTLQPVATQGAGILGVSEPVNPGQTIVFTLSIGDLANILVPGVAASLVGVKSVLAALELLMYPASNAAGSLTLFVWGPNRIIPVRVAGLNILEEMFGLDLAPIQATVEVTLTVATTDVPGSSFLLDYIETLNSLAAAARTSQSSPLGVENL